MPLFRRGAGTQESLPELRPLFSHYGVGEKKTAKERGCIQKAKEAGIVTGWPGLSQLNCPGGHWLLERREAESRRAQAAR